jgi:hypothetical protein
VYLSKKRYNKEERRRGDYKQRSPLFGSPSQGNQTQKVRMLGHVSGGTSTVSSSMHPSDSAALDRRSQRFAVIVTTI